jgi:RHS repeat-associated protein
LAKHAPNGTITYTYDYHGNIKGISSSNTGGANVSYSYDALNRPTTVTDSHRGSNETSYTYDAVGNLANVKLPNGSAVTYQYDSLNRLTNMQSLLTSNSSLLASYAYTLGQAGNRTNVAELSRSVTYTYDNLYRLNSETITNDPSNNGIISYTYDPVGNRQQRSSSVTPISTQNFANQYDANDRLTAGYGYDADGSTTTDPAGKTYTYDSLDRLLTVTGTGLSESFAYDGDGNKVSQTVNGVTTNYLVDTHNLTGYAQVLDEIQSGSVNRTYTYGLNRIAQDQLISGNWSASYYGYDGQGSVRYLMDASGNILNTYTLDAFGNSISSTGTVPNENLYDGEQVDANTGFYNLRARWMNPSIGRFQSMDSYEGETDEPLSLNKYSFTASNPMNLSDPSGRDFDLGSFSLSIAIVGTLATTPMVLYHTSSLINDFSMPDGLLMSYRFEYGKFGFGGSVGVDVVDDFNSGEVAAFGVGSVGGNISLDGLVGKPGNNVSVGYIYNMNTIDDFDKPGAETTIPAGLLLALSTNKLFSALPYSAVDNVLAALAVKNVNVGFAGHTGYFRVNLFGGDASFGISAGVSRRFKLTGGDFSSLSGLGTPMGDSFDQANFLKELSNGFQSFIPGFQ